MTENTITQDGRVRRRLTNTQRVLDALLELGAERQADVGPRAVAERARVSLRSLYRFFPDPEQMLLAALHHQVEHSGHLYSIPDPGVGPLRERIAAFVDRRLQLHAVMTPLPFLTTGAASAAMPLLISELRNRRAALEAMARAQFAPELQQMAPQVANHAVLSVHVLTQRASLNALRHEQSMSPDDARSLLIGSIYSVLHQALQVTPTTTERA